MAPEQAWRVTLAEPPSAAGAMDDQRVYIPLRDEGLVALDRERGTMIWLRPITASGAPVARQNLVFVATPAGLIALDSGTGTTQWAARLDGAIIAPLLWATGWLIAVVEPDEVVALRAADGSVIWRERLGASTTNPAVPGGDGALYFSLDDGRVVGLALADGRLLWEQRLPGTLSEPVTGRDRVFVGSTDNYFYAFDADDGRLAWRWRGGGDVIGAAVDDDVVYFASLDNIVRAANVGNGNQRWRKITDTRPLFTPRAFDGIVVVTGLAPAMTVYVGRNGAVQGSYVAQGTLLGPPLLARPLKPLRVTFVTITREGVVEGMRSTALMYREAAPAPLAALPGRPLRLEQLP